MQLNILRADMRNNLLSRRNPEQEEIIYRANLVAAAHHIVAAPAQDVLLLEDHHMFYPRDMVLHKPSRIILEEGGFSHAFSEVDRYMVFEKPAQPDVEALISRRDSQNLQNLQRLRSERAAYLMHNLHAGRLIYQPVGDDQISEQEILDDLKNSPGGAPFIERLVLEPLQSVLRTSPQKIISEAAFQTLLAPGGVDLTGIARYYLDHPANANSALIKERVAKDGHISGLMGDFISELARLRRSAIHWRSYGRADESMASLMVATERKRSLTQAGLLHGIFANNPAALPKQLLKQTGAAPYIIMFTDRERGSYLRNALQTPFGQGRLRTDITVYDFDLRGGGMPLPLWLAVQPLAAPVSVHSSQLSLG
ncbi:MAG TPA: hypothetical protein VHB73_02125 [Alphaproteobacteria bacterium]|nr:hypothetical protein [Alphaproteobacteria bacterium]